MTTRTFALTLSGLPAEGCEFVGGPVVVRCASGEPSVTVFESMRAVDAGADSGSVVFHDEQLLADVARVIERGSDAVQHLRLLLAELVGHGLGVPAATWPAASAADAWLEGLSA